MSWLLFKRFQEQAVIGKRPCLDMTSEEFYELLKYVNSRVEYFEDLSSNMKEKYVFMGKEIRIKEE